MVVGLAWRSLVCLLAWILACDWIYGVRWKYYIFITEYSSLYSKAASTVLSNLGWLLSEDLRTTLWPKRRLGKTLVVIRLEGFHDTRLQTRFGRSKKNREQIKIVEIPSRWIKIENGRNEFSIVEEALKTRNLNIGDLRHSSRGIQIERTSKNLKQILTTNRIT